QLRQMQSTLVASWSAPLSRSGISAANRQQIACHSALASAAGPAVRSAEVQRSTTGLPNIYVQQQSLPPFVEKSIAAIRWRLHQRRRYVSAKGSGSPAGGDMRKTLRIIDISA